MNKVKACVLGKPIEHSLSPLIHNAAYSSVGIDGSYSKVEADTEMFAQTISALIDDGYNGFNVTMPCKAAAFDFCDEIHGSAKRLRSVNTIVIKDSITHGYSTDGDGFVNFMINEQIGIAKKKITVIGSGGAASTICDALYSYGANIKILARNLTSAKKISDEIQNFYPLNPKGSTIQFTELKDGDDVLSNSDIIINATPVGMLKSTGEKTQAPFDLNLLNTEQVVIDTIYFPFLTPLLEKAKSLDCLFYNGIYMLLYQAALSFELMTGLTAPINDMKLALISEVDLRSS